jgi:hypothetical protein
MKPQTKPKSPSREELAAEVARLRAIIREAADYPFQSVNLHNILKKGLYEEETRQDRTTHAR